MGSGLQKLSLLVSQENVLSAHRQQLCLLEIVSRILCAHFHYHQDQLVWAHREKDTGVQHRDIAQGYSSKAIQKEPHNHNIREETSRMTGTLGDLSPHFTMRCCSEVKKVEMSLEPVVSFSKPAAWSGRVCRTVVHECLLLLSAQMHKQDVL